MLCCIIYRRSDKKEQDNKISKGGSFTWEQAYKSLLDSAEETQTDSL